MNPKICQQVGEEHHHPDYQTCLQCKLRTCPVNMIYSILKNKFPRLIEELERELAGEI